MLSLALKLLLFGLINCVSEAHWFPSPQNPTSNIRKRSDSFVFQRLAERKCLEYLDFTYETITVFNFTEKVSTCNDFHLTVVGGKKAKSGEYPHMALVGYKSEDDTNKPQWLCGGAIISMRFILTAAHCIKTSRGFPTHVRIGDLDHQSTADEALPQTIKVSNSILHEQYRPPIVYNDIGLLELEHSIHVTKYARPACLHVEPSVLATLPLIATGWGRTDFGGDSSDHLLEVTLQHFSTGDCSPVYEVSRRLPGGLNEESQMCAGSRTERKDTCEGDSGGPLQIVHEESKCMFNVVGVTSFGKGCGIVGVPGVYTRVSHYIDWIEQRAFVHG